MHTKLEFDCPHCMEKNPPFGEQRCVHCGVNMLSDREQQLRAGKITSLAEKLDEQLLFLRAGKKENASIPYAYDLLDQLSVFKAGFPFLSPLLDRAAEELSPFPRSEKRIDRTLQINLLILGFLILIPIMMALTGAPPMVIGLLLLPVIGWSYIGIYAYLKNKKAGR